MNNIEYATKRIAELNDKNKTTEGYSLGDCLLLDRFENELIKYGGYDKITVRKLSPSYYDKTS